MIKRKTTNGNVSLSAGLSAGLFAGLSLSAFCSLLSALCRSLAPPFPRPSTHILTPESHNPKHLFRANSRKAIETNPEKPLSVPAGSDTLDAILKVTPPGTRREDFVSGNAVTDVAMDSWRRAVEDVFGPADLNGMGGCNTKWHSSTVVLFDAGISSHLTTYQVLTVRSRQQALQIVCGGDLVVTSASDSRHRLYCKCLSN